MRSHLLAQTSQKITQKVRCPGFLGGPAPASPWEELLPFPTLLFPSLFTHKLHCSPFLGLPYRLLNMNPRKELLRSRWVIQETPTLSNSNRQLYPEAQCRKLITAKTITHQSGNTIPGNRFPETQSQPANTIPEIEPRRHNSGNRKLGTGRKQVSGNFQATRRNTIGFGIFIFACLCAAEAHSSSGNLVFVLLFCPSNIENKAQSVCVYLGLEGFVVEGSGFRA